MAVILGLLSAALFGTGDFFGGMAAKRVSVLQVVAVSHAIGLVGVGVAAIVIANPINGTDVALGALGGLAGLVGVALLYRLLSIGPMSVVAPLTALTSAALPAGWGVLGGERFSIQGWLGILLALVAVGFASSEIGSSDDGQASLEQPVTAGVVGQSLLAGAGFGLFFIALGSTSSSSAPWAVVAARTTTTALLFAILLVGAYWYRFPMVGASPGTGSQGALATLPRRVMPRLSAGGWYLLVGAGVADTGANLTFLYATQLGALTLVSVLAALYPITTVALAWIFTGEKLGRLRVAALALAIVAAQLLSVG